MSYNRYSKFISGNNVEIVPFIPIRHRATDMYTEYEHNRTRLDVLSNEFYGDASYGWLILQANPELRSCEFEIDGSVEVRIPFPLEEVIAGYEKDIDKHKLYYGSN